MIVQLVQKQEVILEVLQFCNHITNSCIPYGLIRVVISGSTMKQLLLSLYILFYSAIAATEGLSGYGKIGQVKIGSNDVRISAEKGSNWNNPDKCNQDDVTHYLLLKKSNDNFDNIFSAMLTAKVSGSTVNFYLKDCGGTLPLITTMYFE